LYFETDTLVKYADPIFKVNGVFDSVTWIIGNSQNIRHAVQFSLSFQDSVGNVPVTCIVYHASKQECYNGKLTDTFRRNLVVVGNHARYHGKYRGVSSLNPADTFTIAFGVRGPTSDYVRMYNFPKGSDSIDVPFTNCWDRFYFDRDASFIHIHKTLPFVGDSAYRFQGTGIVYNNDIIKIDITEATTYYRYFNTVDNFYKDTSKNYAFIFTGKKIN
jgi:hypothetical protein